MITVTKCNAPAAAVTIADIIFGLPVVSIGDGAFFGCTSLASVTIPVHPRSLYLEWCKDRSLMMKKFSS
jgi:hypothetical protein